jgi:omega-6 fatty acid desaturase (delta-12 desaturase)
MRSATSLTEVGCGTAPSPAAVAHLRPESMPALLHTLGLATALVSGLALASSQTWIAYLSGQLLLAAAFVHAFVLLHEAGHNTLFAQRRLNRLVGHFAGLVALIPFHAWQRIHARHHRYTGWQDLDATTATLVSRMIRPWERRVIDFAWRAWLPLFSVLYRLQNYWNLPRMRRFLDARDRIGRIRTNLIVQLLVYGVLIALIGPWSLLELIGPGLLLALMIEDVLLLSQHTHIPQHLSDGGAVQPFRPLDQEQYTRSLKLPQWLSALVMHFDAHELHHMYPNVPGYRLHRIAYTPRNEVNWLRWIKAAKALRGTQFLFSNRNDTGAPV